MIESIKSITSEKNKLVFLVFFLTIAIVPTFISKPYYLDILFQVLLFAALATSWNIIGGFGGQFSFGHAVFFGIGAYTTAILYMNFQISPWLSMWLGCLISMCIAVVIALPTFRLRGPFFSIATLIINQLVLVLILHFKGLTNGPQGILIPYEPSFMNMIFDNRVPYVYIGLIYLLITVLLSYRVLKSKLGFQLQAIREDQDASRMLGVNPFKVKMYGLLISVFLTSIGGSIFAMYITYLDPHQILSLAQIGAMFALICMIGGIGTIAGPIVGAMFIIPLDILVSGKLGGVSPGLNVIVMSILLILSAIFFKNGIVGTAKNLAVYFTRNKKGLTVEQVKKDLRKEM